MNQYKFQIYRAENNEFAWRLISVRNGNVVADGAETYKRKFSVKRMISRLRAYAEFAVVEDLTK
jgi:uncharacterized protein YegP (UPF0339 family)